MAETKMTNRQLHEVAVLKKEFGLSISQCCYWLERRHSVYISRQRFHYRLEKLDIHNLPVHVSEVLESMGIACASR